jgi:hypothetical protein
MYEHMRKRVWEKRKRHSEVHTHTPTNTLIYNVELLQVPMASCIFAVIKDSERFFDFIKDCDDVIEIVIDQKSVVRHS